MGYAFSLHLKGDNEEALKVIDSINNITKNNPLTGVEKSEVNINDKLRRKDKEIITFCFHLLSLRSTMRRSTLMVGIMKCS